LGARIQNNISQQIINTCTIGPSGGRGAYSYS